MASPASLQNEEKEFGHPNLNAWDIYGRYIYIRGGDNVEDENDDVTTDTISIYLESRHSEKSKLFISWLSETTILARQIRSTAIRHGDL